jgi:HSP20 family protein
MESCACKVGWMWPNIKASSLSIEYNVGHYSRSFQLSSKIDQSKIEAALTDGVLSVTLPKVEEAKPRAIDVR